jgi:hypothetical protein
MRSFRLQFVISLCIGAAIMWIATLPTWENSGIASILILGCSAALAFLNPARAYVFALAVSAWVALMGLIHRNPPALFAIVIGISGAFVGAYARRLLAHIVP